MIYDQALIEELNLLIRFPETTMEGLKVHHDANPVIVEAAVRLFDKGLISQKDGGYLTDLGLEASQTARLLLGLLSPQDN